MIPARKSLLLLLAAAAVACGCDGASAWTSAKEIAKRVAGYPAWKRRAAERRAEPPCLAASQVGYAPQMRKLFTSPRPFESFRVVSEADGRVAYQGGRPARSVETDVLGPLHVAWVGDFTPLAAPGRYRVVLADGLSSHPFDVGPNVFTLPVRAVQRALYFQRAFTAIEPAYAFGPWTHPNDADRAPPGVRKGWHDAGDLSLYNSTTASTVFWLLSSYADFSPSADDTGIPESGNGVPDLLDEARWGLEWMLSVQDGSGGFRNSTCLERYGPYGTNRPEAAATYVAGEVGTLPSARAVGTLAFAARVFRDHDRAFAERCLEAARRGYEYLGARPGESSDGPTCPAFRLDGNAEVGRDVRMYAAAGMLLATGEPRFREDFEASFQELDNDDASTFRMNWQAALLYLRAPAGTPSRKALILRQLRTHADRALRDGEESPFGWATRYAWSSIQAGFQRSDVFSVPACLADPQGAARDCEQALANVHYALGRNSLHLCYVSGLPGVTHGRRHAFHQWLAALRAEPFLFPGMVAGGPVRTPDPHDASYPHARPVPVWGYFGDPAMPRDDSTPVDGRYTDNDSWCTNEVDIEWQAFALYALYFAQWRAAQP